MLPITLAQVKPGNTSENLLNEIRQNIYSLYREKEVTKKVYNNITNSIMYYDKNEYYIYQFWKKNKTSDPHGLLLNLTDKIDLRTIIDIYYIVIIHGKISKSHIRIINWKYQLQHRMKNLNYLMDHILYQIFKVILNIY